MPIAIVSSTSTSTPRKVRKLTNRKNYLRQKLLRTFTKPYSNSLISEFPHENPEILPNESPPEEKFSLSSEQFSAEGGEELEEFEIREVRVAEVTKSVEVMEKSVSGFSKGSIFKFGLWLLGAFVFQTICAVWVLGSADINDKIGNNSNEKDKSGIMGLVVNAKDKSRVKLLVNGNKGFETSDILYLDEEDMQKKIKEIQVMAREARERERLEMETNGFESNDNGEEDEEVDFGKSGIEKEVNDRLIKLRKRLGNVQEKLQVSFTDNRKKGGGQRDEEEKDDLGEKEGNMRFFLKKKYKFRGSLIERTDKPKGFEHSDHMSVPKVVMKDGGSQVLMKGDISGGDVDLLDKQELDLPGSVSEAGLSMGLEKDGERKQMVQASKSSRTAGKKLAEWEKRKQGKRVGLVESESNGLTQDKKEGMSETVESGKTTVLETPAISNEHNQLNQKDDSKGRGTENRLAAKIGNKKSESETDLWWLRLPYVLVIFMHRGLDDEGPRGPFTLKSSSNSNSKLSHTVAFEDRGDATKFCYILQSFFEDLGDFSAEIVPLSIKELKAAVKSQIIKVLVVRKGQLKLYAGQPLPDVEMALRSILGQN